MAERDAGAQDRLSRTEVVPGTTGSGRLFDEPVTPRRLSRTQAGQRSIAPVQPGTAMRHSSSHAYASSSPWGLVRRESVRSAP